jgi:hypothetical protein
MAGTAYETWDSREFSLGEGSPSLVYKFVIVGSPNELDAEAVILNQTPAYGDGLWRLNVHATPKGAGVWEGTANYGIPKGGAEAPGQSNASPPPPPQPPPPPSPDAPLGPEWSVDMTGGTQHVTKSLATRRRRMAGFASGPNLHGAIGATDKGVEGCDVGTGVFELTQTRKLPTISIRYLRTLHSLKFHTNDADFWGFKRGELLFKGPTAQYRDSDGWSLTFRFEASPNEVVIEVEPDDPGHFRIDGTDDDPARRGHDYLWFLFDDAVDGNFKIPRPVAAYVEQVYPEGDFNRLGI